MRWMRISKQIDSCQVYSYWFIFKVFVIVWQFTGLFIKLGLLFCCRRYNFAFKYAGILTENFRFQHKPPIRFATGQAFSNSLKRDFYSQLLLSLLHFPIAAARLASPSSPPVGGSVPFVWQTHTYLSTTTLTTLSLSLWRIIPLDCPFTNFYPLLFFSIQPRERSSYVELSARRRIGSCRSGGGL